MSVFLAIDLDPATRAAAAACLAPFTTLEAKWQRVEKLHLTLVFLGNPKPDALAALPAQLEPFARTQPRCVLHLQGSGTFKTARAPAVWWLGVGGQLEALQRLQANAARLLLGADEARPFVPHVTLARAKHPGRFTAPLAATRAFTSPPFSVDALTLFESTHDTWRALGRFPLDGDHQR